LRVFNRKDEGGTKLDAMVNNNKHIRPIYLFKNKGTTNLLGGKF